MTKLVVPAVAILLASAAGAAYEAHAGGGSSRVRDVSLELVGEVTNAPLGVTPATSRQYGYVSYLRGLRLFTADPENETTALFTFYLQATTTRVINNGPLRVITRVGQITIYRDPGANGTFADPDTFRDGTPVLVAGLRQEAVLDTISNTFTTVNMNTITATNSFPAGKQRLQLGRVGQKFRTMLNGHNNMPAPPSGFFAGYTTS
jgi:hypothetical protein